MGDHNFDQEVLKPTSKPVLLSSDEMRRVLDDLGKEENEEEEEEWRWKQDFRERIGNEWIGKPKLYSQFASP